MVNFHKVMIFIDMEKNATPAYLLFIIFSYIYSSYPHNISLIGIDYFHFFTNRSYIEELYHIYHRDPLIISNSLFSISHKIFDHNSVFGHYYIIHLFDFFHFDGFSILGDAYTLLKDLYLNLKFIEIFVHDFKDYF